MFLIDSGTVSATPAIGGVKIEYMKETIRFGTKIHVLNAFCIVGVQCIWSAVFGEHVGPVIPYRNLRY